MYIRVAILLFFVVSISFAVPVKNWGRQLGPTVTLDQATFVGTTTGTTNLFLGIPFAQPPTGNLRFNLPQTLPPYNETYTAIVYGPSCPQQSVSIPIPLGLAANATDYLLNSIFNILTPASEDCLTLNVVVPATVTPDSNLPVVVWIFGGGFEQGGTSSYDGSTIVDRSIVLGEPVIYVSMNYRLNGEIMYPLQIKVSEPLTIAGFGFMPGAEIQAAGVGNLGLQDQRIALQWVQKYIGAFGGDPTQVTIWGESAGAISVALQLVTNGGNPEGLFRAAFMESGSPIPVGSITNGQQYYDSVVVQTGCSSASDTLQCLREVPYETLLAAIDNTPNDFSYQSLDLAYLPRVDGVFLTAPPQRLVAEGSVADVPLISGDCDDEGTLFSLSNSNITTTEELQEYIQTYYLSMAPASVIEELLVLYPEDPTQGSPYNTGDLNALTPQFKRIASFLGDAVFQGPRRYLLQSRSGKQNLWSFLSTRLKLLPVIGSFHTSDLLNIYGDGEMTDYLINFVVHLDPNGAGGHLYWPQYTTDSPDMMTFQDGLISLAITQDTYRQEAMAYVTNATLTYIGG